MKKKIISSILCMTMFSALFTSCSAPKSHKETTPADLPRPIDRNTETEETETEETLPLFHCINPKFEDLTAEEIVSILTLEE